MKEAFTGQNHIVKNFRNMHENGLLGHAYALTGPAGIGKKTLARVLAGMLLCYDAPEKAPCGHCNACKTFEAGTNPNLLIIAPKTQKILIEQIRVLIEDISVKPPVGRKVYIIEDADRMTPQAQNCLLKTLEEPPSYAVILLTVSHIDSLLLTIRSRVAQLSLHRYSDLEIRKILAARSISGNQADSAIAFSEGIPGKAISLSENQEFHNLRELVIKSVLSRSLANTDDLELNNMLSKDKDALAVCLGIMESVYRDAALVGSGITDGLINGDKRDNIIEYARKRPMQEIMDNLARIEEIRSNIRSYMNYQLAVDMITLI